MSVMIEHGARTPVAPRCSHTGTASDNSPEAVAVLETSYVLSDMYLSESIMPHKDRAALYGRIGLVLASFAIIGGVVAEPLLRPLRSPRLTVAQR